MHFQLIVFWLKEQFRGKSVIKYFRDMYRRCLDCHRPLGGRLYLPLAQFGTLSLLGSLHFPVFPIISHGNCAWLRWDSFDAVCTPKPGCLFCSQSVCLGKYFSPNLQNGICVAMDLRRGPGRVNINNQSCRPPLFGLESHSGTSGWNLQEPCRLTAKQR